MNLNEVEDCGAHQSIINEDDEDAYSDHENDTSQLKSSITDKKNVIA